MFARVFKLKSPLGSFARARDGATAVEFAMIAPVFFLLIVGMAEVTLMGFAQSSLDFAVGETARRIRTGEVQAEGLSQGELRDDMCGTLNWLINVSCEGTLHLDVDRYASFVDVRNNSPMAGGGFNEGEIDFNPGGPSDIVMVRAYMQWPMITPLFEQFFANMSDGTRILSSTLLFRNEPFPDPNP